MQQTDAIIGFSELKDLLIRTYKIEKNREHVKLYFSQEDKFLSMHDYDDHKKEVLLIKDLDKRELTDFEGSKARKLVKYSMTFQNPVEYLNNEFKLSGFFRP